MRSGGPTLPLALMALLALPSARTVAVEDEYEHLEFFQQSLPSRRQSGEVLHMLEDEEVFHVDLEGKEIVWRLPDFINSFNFDAQEAQRSLAVDKNNLQTLVKRSNRTQAQDVAPTAMVYPKNPVELGDRNTLICFVDQFFPPVLNITWLKNGEVVSDRVTETYFYHNEDNSFRKFSYLSFIPKPEDFYVCKVDHWGLTESLSKFWHCKGPTPIPETLENVVCALGLALGVLGVITGTIFCFKARQQDEGGRCQGPR